ncbi:MAG: hypothetical protein KAS30_00380, partial [Candidatus Diapherotrites archaeon]|nr:hypothetical protein [Candidatus Diapherotrites archaeon]
KTEEFEANRSARIRSRGSHKWGVLQVLKGRILGLEARIAGEVELLKSIPEETTRSNPHPSRLDAELRIDALEKRLEKAKGSLQTLQELRAKSKTN